MQASAFFTEIAEPENPVIFSPNGLQTFEVPGASRFVVYDFKNGDVDKPVMVFLHGLGDDLFKMQAMENWAVDAGYSILRVDLHLHGRSLQEYMRVHRKLPQRLDFAENASDLEALIVQLNFKDLILVGHSYGGAIAFDLANKLTTNHSEIVVESVHQLGPYVQRVDKFLKAYLSSPRFMISQASDMMKMAGVHRDFVDNIMQPLADMMNTMFSGARMMKTHLEDMIKWDAMSDLVLDPIFEGYLRAAYGRYFVFNLKKKWRDFNDDEKKLLEVQVEAAMKITRGIRSFDLLNGDLPKNMPPIQVIGGINDQLVVADQLREYSQRLRVAGYKTALVFLKGALADHLFPRRMPKETFAEIVDFNQKYGRKRRLDLSCTTELQ
jgi:pimeloyl-ACP methyl ester carboxylesterase